MLLGVAATLTLLAVTVAAAYLAVWIINVFAG